MPDEAAGHAGYGWLVLAALVLVGCDGCGERSPEAVVTARREAPSPPPEAPPLEPPETPPRLVPHLVEAPFPPERYLSLHTIDDAVLVSDGRDVSVWHPAGHFSSFATMGEPPLGRDTWGTLSTVVGRLGGRVDGIVTDLNPMVFRTWFVRLTTSPRAVPGEKLTQALGVAHRGPTT